MFSKQHFESLAKIFKTNETKQEIIEGCMEMFETDNPRFNKERFLKACENKLIVASAISKKRVNNNLIAGYSRLMDNETTINANLPSVETPINEFCLKGTVHSTSPKIIKGKRGE
jgi:hypothetical protein